MIRSLSTVGSRGGQNDWSYKDCIRLGIGCGLCALAYYNAYSFILCSIFVYFITSIKQGNDLKEVFKKAGIVLGVAFLIAGWFFIRNIIIHDGDIFGLASQYAAGEKYAMDQYKPSLRNTAQHAGISMIDMVINGYNSAPWYIETIQSFIGRFGFMNVVMENKHYLIYYLTFGIGLVLFLIQVIKNWKSISFNQKIFGLFMLLACCITIGLSIYYSYTIDYQPQGRYIMAILIPLMLAITYGWQLLPKKLHLNWIISIGYLYLFYCAYQNFILQFCCW